MDCVLRLISSRNLVDPRSLVYRLGHSGTRDVEEALLGQYQVARQNNAKDWIQQIRVDCDVLVGRGWIEDNLPSTDGSRLYQPNKKQVSASAGAACLEALTDARLRLNPYLPVFRAIAMDSPSDLIHGEPSSSNVTEPCHQEEARMEKDPLPLDKPAESSAPAELGKVNWLFNVTINDISVIYVTAHRCAGGLKKKFDLRSGSQRHRHFAGFFNVPVLAPTRDQIFYTVIPTHRPNKSPFTITLGIRRCTFST